MVAVSPDFEDQAQLADNYRQSGDGTTVEQLAFLKDLLEKNDSRFSFTREVQPRTPAGKVLARLFGKDTEKVEISFEPEKTDSADPETIHLQLQKTNGKGVLLKSVSVHVCYVKGQVVLCNVTEDGKPDRVYCNIEETAFAKRRYMRAEGLKVTILKLARREEKAQEQSSS